MKKITRIVMVLIMLLALTAGYVTMNVLTTKDTEYDLSAMKDNLEVITKEPHSTLLHYESLSKVREYIVEQLNSCGVEANIFTYKNVPTHKNKDVELNNIYGKIDGKDGENGSYILLVSHYDSASGNPQNDDGYSYGAADDGYGVATILETIRVMSSKRGSMINGIKILITDGEELRLLGSKAAVEQNPEIFDNVSYVVNLESRGTSGTALMFELFGNEERVLELYKKGSSQITSSFITDIYGGCERSDFYNLSTLNLPGINLTAIDEVENYHTTQDSYENISDETLQHFITQVLPITEAFTMDEKYSDTSYFLGSEASNFFNIAPGVVLSFSSIWIYIFTAILTIITIFILFKRREHFTEILSALVSRILLLFVIAIASFALSFILALITGAVFKLAHMGKVPGDDIFVIVIPVILYIFFLFSNKFQKHNNEISKLADMMLQTILLLAQTLLYPGTAYCILIPYALFILIDILNKFIFKNKASNRSLILIKLIPGAVLLLLFAPLIFVLQQAFSIASLSMNCVIMVYIAGSIKANLFISSKK